MSQALLLAEAEPATREFLARHLASDGFAVLGADAGREALELVERERPDLVLVGGLPDAPALEVCRVLREGEPGRSWDRDVPVIVLGEARADAVDRVHAFERGCDDFVPRPFHYEELVARIHAVLRRTQPGLRERLAAGPVAIDRATRLVTVHGLTVGLSAKEYELLVKLATQPTRVFTKEELLRDVWGFRSLGSKRRLYRSGGAAGALTLTTRTQLRVGTAAGRGSSDWSRPPARASRGRSDGLREVTQDASAGARSARSEGEGERRRGRAGDTEPSSVSGVQRTGLQTGESVLCRRNSRLRPDGHFGGADRRDVRPPRARFERVRVRPAGRVRPPSPDRFLPRGRICL